MIGLGPSQGKIIAQGRLLLQDTFMVAEPDGGLLNRMKERRVFLFEQIVIFSEPLDRKRGFSMPGYLYKYSIKVQASSSDSFLVSNCIVPDLVVNLKLYKDQNILFVCM